MDLFPTADEMFAQLPAESMQSLLATLRYHVLDTHVSSVNSLPPPLLSRGDVVEIQGSAASGKSHLLYHLLATCILPHAYNSASIGGWACAAMLLDTDGKFSVKRFRRILQSRLSRILRSPNDNSLLSFEDQSMEDVIGRCLSRLHVFRPQSSAQLAATLLHLPEYHSTHLSLQSCDIGLLAIDSLSAFYWTDRFLLEQWRTTSETVSSMNAASTEPHNPMRHVTAALQRFRVLRGPLTVLTNWGLNPSPTCAHFGKPYVLYKQHLHPFPSPFDADAMPSRPLGTRAISTQLQSSSGPFPHQDVELPDASGVQHVGEFSITHHVTLSPTPAASSPDLSETEGDVVPHSGLVRNGLLQASIRTPASASVTHFVFRVTEDDILFDTSDEV